MFNRFIKGAGSVFEGSRAFFSNRKLWKYAILPLALVAFFYFAILALTVAGAWKIAETAAAGNGYWQWLREALGVLFVIIAAATVSTVMVLLFSTVYELFGGLFFDALVARYFQNSGIEIVQEKSLRFNLRFIRQSCIYSLNTLFLYLFFAVLGLFLPVITQAAAFFIISWRIGISYLAVSGYAFNCDLDEVKRTAAANRMEVCGYGAACFMATLIPGAILLLLPGVILGGAEVFADISKVKRFQHIPENTSAAE